MKKRPTRDDVARAAGVSPATVSRVYNQPDLVSPSRVAKVQQAAGELGYEPDLHASALRRAGTGRILLIMPPGSSDRASEGRVYDWLFADAVRSVQETLACTTFTLQLATARGLDAVDQLIRDSRCDGVICGIGTVDQLPPVLAGSSLPYVCCTQGDCLPATMNQCSVDEIGGGMEAAKAFVRRGRLKLAHITGDLVSNSACQERWCGFHTNCVEAGIAEPLLLDGKLGIAGGYRSGVELAAQVKAGRVDGVFVVNDLTAVGVMHALLEHGMRIPQDISIIAYDNLPLVRTLPVPLASIDINIGRVYQQATEALIANLRTPQPIRLKVLPVLMPGPSL